MDKPTVKDIRDLKDDLTLFYGGLRRQQAIHQSYYDEDATFDSLVGIKAPYHVVHTGSAARIVDTLVENIILNNPQAFRKAHKDTDKAHESARKVTAMLNTWLKKLREQAEELVKNAAQRGEAFGQIEYNPDNKEMPISLTAPDPMNVYPDPQEVEGVPLRVIKSFRMTVGAVKQLYPDFKSENSSTTEIDYLAYWDKDWRYFEADEQPLLKGGIQPNILKFVPFVHVGAGFGKSSPDGKPEAKYVGRLHKALGRLIEECQTESRIDSGLALWANPYGFLEHNAADAPEVSEEVLANIDLSPGHIFDVPFGLTFTVNQGVPPPREVFAHLAGIKSSLDIETPPVTQGVPSMAGASGRQEDIYTTQFKRKPNKVQKNVEWLLSKLFSRALQIIYTQPVDPIWVETVEFVNGKNIRKLETVTRGDIDGYYGCTIEFKPDKDVERSSEIMLYRTLANEGRVSWKKLLMEGLGMTEAEAEDEMAEAVADQVIRTNLTAANIAAEEAMTKMGMGRYVDEMKAQGMPLIGGELMPQRQGQPRNLTGNPESRGAVRQMTTESTGNPARSAPPSTGG